VSDRQAGLDRDSLIDGLSDLIERVRAAGISPVRISIVGGVALALSHIDRTIVSPAARETWTRGELDATSVLRVAGRPGD
jgi:hypothetical protein